MGFFSAFTGVMKLISGQKAMRETTRVLQHARIALIGFAVLCGMLFICTLIVTIYFLMRIFEMMG